MKTYARETTTLHRHENDTKGLSQAVSLAESHRQVYDVTLSVFKLALKQCLTQVPGLAYFMQVNEADHHFRFALIH